MRGLTLLVAGLSALGMPIYAGAGTRIKELAAVEGVRDNQLVGYGLVVGLNGTGDRRQTLFSAQSVTNLLERMGVTVPANAIRVSNVAAVIVTSSLPPYASPGNKLDVTVGALGDASSLQGGLLIMTSLKGADGQVYAIAQGSVVTGGFVAGPSITQQTVNHPTAGRIANGATIERAPPTVAGNTQSLRLQLRNPDFTTCSRIASAINTLFSGSATPENAGVVHVAVPANFAGRYTEFVSAVELLPVEADVRTKIVVNERTGTVVMGKNVLISPVAVMHGTLSVEVQTNFNVSQPAPFSEGRTMVTPEVQVGVKEEKTRSLMLNEGATVEQMVRALNSIGATARDIIAILQALRSAGALQAELEII